METKTDGMWYRVLVARGCEEPWSPGSLHVIPPQRPAAWREAGLLV